MLWWNQRGGSWLPSAIALAVTFISFDFCSAIECNLYIAESTIPNAGLGIFSGIELNARDPVGYEDVSIPIFNFTAVAMHDYVWAGEVMGMKLEAAPALIEAKSPVSVTVEWATPTTHDVQTQYLSFSQTSTP